MTISPAAGLIAALLITLDAMRAIPMGSDDGPGLVLLAGVAALGAALNARPRRPDSDSDDNRT